jgi:hypothetical protein
MVSGLPFDSKEFAILPPHFPNEIKEKMDDMFWQDLLGDYKKYPIGMQAALPYLLASVVHHEHFLRSKLRVDHPVFSSRVFNNQMIDDLRGKTLLGTGRCMYTDMKATGIPNHLAIAEQIFRLEEKHNQLSNKLNELETHLKNELAQNVATKVTEEIQENFEIDGMAPVSMRAIENRLNTLEERLISKIQGRNSISAVENNNKQSEGWKTWYWGDGLICHYVPPDWQFPARLRMKALWDLWWFGDRTLLIRPFSGIDFSKELKDTYIRMRSCRAQKAVDYVLKIAKEMQLLTTCKTISKLSLEDSDEIFSNAFPSVIDKLYKNKKVPGRPLEITYGTIYDNIPKSTNRRKRRRRTST